MRAAGLGVDAGPSSFALAIGDGRVWVRDTFVLRDPNGEMGFLFGFQLLEIVLVEWSGSPSSSRDFFDVLLRHSATNIYMMYITC
jgi:hypothetical protein